MISIVGIVVCLDLLNQLYHPGKVSIFANYKSKTKWVMETGELGSLTLSTGIEVIPDRKISSIMDLMDFLWKKHRSELTPWGKLSYWMNQ